MKVGGFFVLLVRDLCTFTNLMSTPKHASEFRPIPCRFSSAGEYTSPWHYYCHSQSDRYEDSGASDTIA